MRRMPRDNKGRYWMYAAASQGMQKVLENHQKVKRGKEGFPYRFQRERRLTYNLIS